MKTYNEMADSVFEKIEAYGAKKKRRQKLITKTTQVPGKPRSKRVGEKQAGSCVNHKWPAI